MARSCKGSQLGFSVLELLIIVVVLGALTLMGWNAGSSSLARQRLESATRRLDEGIQRSKAEARKTGQPCGLSLEPEGWAPPATHELAPCLETLQAFKEPIAAGTVQIHHNFPNVLRFTSSGLVLDGGTVVLQVEGLALRRCLVMSPPLGIRRLGRYVGGRCEADLSL